MADGGEREASSLSSLSPRRLSLAEEEVEGAGSATWISDLRTPRTGGAHTPTSSAWDDLGSSSLYGDRVFVERFGGGGPEHLLRQSHMEDSRRLRDIFGGRGGGGGGGGGGSRGGGSRASRTDRDVDGSISEIGNLSDVGGQWDESGSLVHGGLAGLRGEESEAGSMFSEQSFAMVRRVELTFVVQDFGPDEDGKSASKQFANTPFYGEIYKAAQSCLNSELNQVVKIGGIFMDTQKLDNRNAMKLIKKVAEQSASPGSNTAHLVLHVSCSGAAASPGRRVAQDQPVVHRVAEHAEAENPPVAPQPQHQQQQQQQQQQQDQQQLQQPQQQQHAHQQHEHHEQQQQHRHEPLQRENQAQQPAQREAGSESGRWKAATFLWLPLLLVALTLMWDKASKQAAEISVLAGNVSALEEIRQQCQSTLAARDETIGVLRGNITDLTDTIDGLNTTVSVLDRDAARARREARERSADHEHTNMHLTGDLDGCRSDLRLREEEVEALKVEREEQRVALEDRGRELAAAAERTSEFEARLERLRASHEACRKKLIFKAPPRATSLQALLFLADVESATLTGSCEDFEGGHLTRVEWIQAAGPSLQLDGLVTAHVMKDVPAGATYLSTNLTLSRHTEGIYRFTLRCTDNLDKVGETNVTVRFKHARHPVLRISGPQVITEGSSSSLQVNCSSEAPRVQSHIYAVDLGTGKTIDVVASSNRSTIDLSALPFGDYNVSVACEDVTFSLWARDTWSVAVRHQGVLGVDLATTYSCVAFDDGSGPQQVFIREAGDDDDDPCMPSCVAFEPRTCFLLVGEPAKQQAAVNPGNTFCDIKNRLTGRRYSEAVVQDYIANASWYHIAPKCKYAVPGDPCDKPVLRVTCGGEERFLEPEEISALLLDTMRLEAEAAAGHKLGPAVISVPAAWNNYQRKATLDSSAIAGLDCRQLVNEPTAAITHVESKLAAERVAPSQQEAAGRPLEKKNVLVFDAGGGTTDVSILFVVIRNGRFEVIGTGGSPVLGGTDFDMALAEGVLLPKLTKSQPMGTGLFDQPRGRALLRQHAEIVKKQLSTKDVAISFIPWNEEGSLEKVIVRREEFESCVESLIEKQVELIKATVKAADLELSHVDEVYFVGGQAQIPAVQRRIRGLFGKAVVFHNEDPHSAVALGACRLASNHVAAEQRSASGGAPIRLAEVTPLQLGIEISGEEYSDEIVPLVKANSGIPLRIMKNFTNGVESTIEVRVLEGPPQARRASDPRAHLLGTFDVEGIPSQSTVTVEFGLDKNGVLNVGAHSKEQSNTMTLKLLSNDGHMLPEDSQRLGEVHKKLWSCAAGRYWQDLAASANRLHQAMAAAALQARPEPECSLFQRFMGTCDTGGRADGSADGAGAAAAAAEAACAAAVRGLRQQAGSPGWRPPSVLTPEQVDELNYRAPKAAGARLDLVVMMDNTGSMTRLIEAAQNGMKDIVAKIRESLGGVVVRVAVVGYRDHGEAYVVKVFQDFTDNMIDVQTAVDGMLADGGGDGPEAVLEALQAVPGLDFHPSAVKLALLVCDAPPHGVEPYDYDEAAALQLSEAALRLHGMGIKVFPVLVEGTHQIDGYNNARKYYAELAANTTGLVATLRDAETILVPFIFNLAASEVNNAHVQSEVKRMSKVFDGTWSSEAMSEVILGRMKKRGKLQRLMVDGEEVKGGGDQGRITPLRGVIGTVAADLATSDVLDLVEQSVHK